MNNKPNERFLQKQVLTRSHSAPYVCTLKTRGWYAVTILLFFIKNSYKEKYKHPINLKIATSVQKHKLFLFSTDYIFR